MDNGIDISIVWVVNRYFFKLRKIKERKKWIINLNVFVMEWMIDVDNDNWKLIFNVS